MDIRLFCGGVQTCSTEIQQISFSVSLREPHVIAAPARVPFVIVRFYNTHLNNNYTRQLVNHLSVV